MADILNNTLTGTLNVPTEQPMVVPPMPAGLKVPDVTGTDKSLNNDIKILTASQQSPNSLMDFQKSMQLSSQLAYKDRQKSELGIESKAFDPTKVSGGTFATIIGNLEAQRGADVGKVYASTLNAYASAQEQITNRLQFLLQLKQAKEQFEAEMKIKKAQLKLAKQESQQSYSLQKKQFDQQKSQWEREFALSMMKAKTASTAASVYSDIGSYRASFQSSSPTINMSTPGLSFDVNSYLGQ